MENLNDIADEIQNMTGDMYEGTITMSEDAFHEYANRIREAAERDREMWRGRVKDALAVADQSTCRLIRRLTTIARSAGGAVRRRASGVGARFRWRKTGTSTRFRSASARNCAGNAPSARAGRRSGRPRA